MNICPGLPSPWSGALQPCKECLLWSVRVVDLDISLAHDPILVHCSPGVVMLSSPKQRAPVQDEKKRGRLGVLASD